MRSIIDNAALLAFTLFIALTTSAVAGIGISQEVRVRTKYIVQLKPASNPEQHLHWINEIQGRGSLGRRNIAGLEERIRIDGGFEAYTAYLDDETVALIRKRDEVVRVDEDELIHAPAVFDSSSQLHDSTARGATGYSQDSAPWNLRVISQRPPASSAKYFYNSQAEGTYAYVLDTGIQITHNEFEGRASFGWTAFPGSTIEDTNGHGTHVAGIIAGRTWGVAKKANVIAVKIFASGASQTSQLLNGISWAVNDITSKNRVGRAVINVSFGEPFKQSVNDAVKAAYDKGILVVAAAGNENSDTIKTSPGSAPEAITVIGMNSTYGRVSSGNYGPNIDLHAPGWHVTSAWRGSNDATNLNSGGAAATPHVSGLALCLLAERGFPSAQEARDILLGAAIKNAVVGVPSNTANLLAYNGSGL